jgi:hypothetical protein
MDDCSGKTLEDWLAEREFFENRYQWKVARQMLEGIQYLHSLDRVHKKISSSNVFFDGESTRLGDFSEGSERTDCMYHDGREVVDSRTDIFSFGILFFELWYPFSTDEERRAVLDDLTGGHIPEEWSRLFPVQAAIVKLCLMEPAEKRPSASVLLQSTLIPAQESRSDSADLKALTSAISSGKISLNCDGVELLTALFGESRRLPFKLSGMEGLGNFRENRAEFYRFCLHEFIRISRGRCAEFFMPKMVHSLAGDDMGPDVMSCDGALHRLYSNIARAFKYWLRTNSINDGSWFSRQITFQDPPGFGAIDEREILTFDILSESRNLDDLLDAMEIVVGFLGSVLPDQSIELRIGHSLLGGAQFKKRIILPTELRDLSRDPGNALHTGYAESLRVVERATALCPDVKPRLDLHLSRKSAGSSMVLVFVVMNQEVAAVAQGVGHKKTPEDLVIVTGLRILMDIVLDVYESRGRPKRKSDSLCFIIMDSFVKPAEHWSDSKREKLAEEDWVRAFVQVEGLCKVLRSEGTVSVIAPNDGEGVAKYRGSGSVLGIVHVDSKGRVFLKLEPEGGEFPNMVRKQLEKVKDVTINWV